MAKEQWIDEWLSERGQTPGTLLCLYLKTMPDERLQELGAKSNNYAQMRVNAKTLRKLVEDGSIEFDWEKMETIFTAQGIDRAEALLKEIIGEE